MTDMLLRPINTNITAMPGLPSAAAKITAADAALRDASERTPAADARSAGAEWWQRCRSDAQQQVVHLNNAGASADSRMHVPPRPLQGRSASSLASRVALAQLVSRGGAPLPHATAGASLQPAGVVEAVLAYVRKEAALGGYEAAAK
jgi:hypothetical protein